MKRILLIYGLLPTVAAILLTALAFSFIDDYGALEILGYATIILCAGVFVFLGVKVHRDRNLGGRMSFVTALKTGIFIVLVPAVIIATMDMIYVTYINPEWYDSYYEKFEQNLEKQYKDDPAKLAEYKEQMQMQREQFGTPGMTWALMFTTVFAIGLISSVISALILKRSPGNPASTATA